MPLYERVAELPLEIEGYTLRARAHRPSRVRAAHDDFHLPAAARRAWARTSPTTPTPARPAGGAARCCRSPATWTFDTFSEHLGGLDLFPACAPRDAGLPRLPPLGVRVGGARPRAAPGGPLAGGRARPRAAARSASSSRCAHGRAADARAGARAGSPPTRRCASSSTRTPDWTDELIAAARRDRRGRLDRLQGRVQGHGRRRRDRPGALPPHRRGVPRRLARGPRPRRPPRPTTRSAPPDRITWDAPIHSVEDIAALRSCRARSMSSRRASARVERAVRRPTSSASSAAWARTAAASTSSASGAARSSCWPRCSIPTRANDIAPAGYDGLDSRSPGCPRARSSRPGPDRLPPAARRLSRRCRPSPARSGSSSKSALAAMQQLEIALRRGARGRDALQGRRAGDPRRARRRADGRRSARASTSAPRSPPRARRSGSSCAAWPRRRWRSPSAAPGDLKVATEKLGQTPADEPPAADAAAHGHRRAAAERGHLRAASAASCC